MASKAVSRGSTGAKLITPWRMLAYEFKTKVENFEFTELHQAILDASNAQKGLETMEGMLSHALELGTVSQVASFLVKTADIMESIGTILRKFPATQVPFATLLNALSFCKDVSIVAALAKLTGFRKVLRVISNDLVYAGLASMLCLKSVGEAFAAAGHDVQLLESLFKPVADNMATRTAIAASMLGYLAPHPAKDVSVRIKLYEAAISMLLATSAADLIAATRIVNDSFTQVTSVLRYCGRSESDKLEIPALAAPAPDAVQIIFARLLTITLADRTMDASNNVILRLLYAMKPHPIFLASPDLAVFMQSVAERRPSEGSLRLLTLYVCAKLVQAEYFHAAVVVAAIESISNPTVAVEERTVGLQLILGLLPKTETRTLIDATLTADKIAPSVQADLASGNANLRSRWICFIHIYTHAIGLTFSSLFQPLAVHIANKLITPQEFKAITKWEMSAAKDEELIERIVIVREQQVAVTGQEEVAREHIIDDESEEMRGLVERYSKRLGQLRSDPVYVKWRRLRDDAMSDHSKICDDRITVLEALATKSKTEGKTQEDALRKTAEDAVQVAVAAHEAELRGIVWDSEELAGKKAVLDARITRVRRQAEKQIADTKAVTVWRDDLVGAMIGAMHQWNRSQLLRSSLLIVEKEEERLRGEGMVSSTTWFSTNRQSLLAREAEGRQRIIAIMDGAEDELDDADDDQPPEPPQDTSQRTDDDDIVPLVAMKNKLKSNLTSSQVIHMMSKRKPAGGGGQQISFVQRMKRVAVSRVERLKISAGDEPIARLLHVQEAQRILVELDRNEQLAYLSDFFNRSRGELTPVHFKSAPTTMTPQNNITPRAASATDLSVHATALVLDANDDDLVSSTSRAFELKSVATQPPSMGRKSSARSKPAEKAMVPDVERIHSEGETSSSDEMGPEWTSVADLRASKALGKPTSPAAAGKSPQPVPLKASGTKATVPVAAAPLKDTAQVEAFLTSFADSLQKVRAAETQWFMYHFQHYENGVRRFVMHAEYSALRLLTIALSESKSRHAVRQSEREWWSYIFGQFTVKMPHHSGASGNSLQAALLTSLSSIGSTNSALGFDQVAEPVFNAWKERRNRILKHYGDFVRSALEIKETMHSSKTGGIVKMVIEVEASERRRLTHAAAEFLLYCAKTMQEETALWWPLFAHIEQERSWRGQVVLDEIIDLAVILHNRPRGKRYRPPKEEIVDEKPRLETSTSNRIKNWQKEVIPSDIPERFDDQNLWPEEGEAEPEDDSLFRSQIPGSPLAVGQSSESPPTLPAPAQPRAQPTEGTQQSSPTMDGDKSDTANIPVFSVTVITPATDDATQSKKPRRRRSLNGPRFVGIPDEESGSDSVAGSYAVSNVGIGGGGESESGGIGANSTVPSPGIGGSGHPTHQVHHIDTALSRASDAFAAYNAALQRYATRRAAKDKLRSDYESEITRDMLAVPVM